MTAKTLVLYLLELNLCGGALTLLCLPLCAALRKLRVPSRLLCLVWLAVGARFLVPGGVPVPIRLPARNAAQTAVTAATALPDAALGLPAVAGTVSAAPEQAAGLGVLLSRLTVWDALAAVWLAGAAVLLVRAAVSYLRLHRAVRLACRTADGCYSCAAVTVPFTLGILRPRVYLPDALQGAERAAVLLHEKTHIRRGDPLTKPLYYLVVCLNWWNPLAHLAFREFEQTMEFACDEAAVGRNAAPQRAAYCESILRYALPHSAPGVLAFGQGRVYGRVAHLLGYRRPSRAALALCCLAVAGACAVCALRPQAQDATPETATEESAAAPQEQEPAAGESSAVQQEPEPAEPQPAPEATAQPTPAPTEAPVSDLAFGWPVESFTYISRFMSAYHKGADYNAPAGTPVLAVQGGTVTTADYHYSYGNYVVIDHGTLSDGHRYQTLYAHMDTLAVAAGDTVAQGQQIGTVGSTGEAAGNHLHIELYVDDTRTDTRTMIPYDNTAAAAALTTDLDFICPLTSYRYLSALYREESADSPDPAHSGTDFAADEGTLVLAAGSGIVTQCGHDETLGYFVTVCHGTSGGVSYATRYACLAGTSVAVGQAVAQGDTLGTVGSTGASTGAHLHLELLANGTPQDPLTLIPD